MYYLFNYNSKLHFLYIKNRFIDFSKKNVISGLKTIYNLLIKSFISWNMSSSEVPEDALASS